MSIASYPHIDRIEGVCGGKPCIEGHRLRVQDIAIEHEWQGLSPAEICREHPGITLSQVHAALTYFYDHRDEIQRDIEAEADQVKTFRQQHPEWVR